MKKISVALGTALVCLTVSSAWAGGAPDSVVYEDTMDYSSGMPSGFNMPVNPSMLANNYANGGMMPSTSTSSSMGMGGMMPSMGMGSSYPSSNYPSNSSNMPVVDMRRVVWQGVQSLPQQQQQNGAMAMSNQNLSQLNQSMSNNMSPIYQMRNSIRDQIMGNRMSDISRMGQSTFRPMIMPGAVQSMISQIQPWNFPSRFQSAMMPAMIPMVSAPIKQNQMAFMQQGIMNNPNFPNVPLPSPVYGGYGGGMGGYGGGMGGYGGGMGGYGGGMGGYGGGMGGYGGGMGGYGGGMGGYGMPQQQQGGYYGQQQGGYGMPQQQGGGYPYGY